MHWAFPCRPPDAHAARNRPSCRHTIQDCQWVGRSRCTLRRSRPGTHTSIGLLKAGPGRSTRAPPWYCPSFAISSDRDMGPIVFPSSAKYQPSSALIVTSIGACASLFIVQLATRLDSKIPGAVQEPEQEPFRLPAGKIREENLPPDFG